MTQHTVTVFGATGKTGRHVARKASARGWRVRAAGRRPPLEPFDWDDERTWTTAAHGSDAAYVLIPWGWRPSPRTAPPAHSRSLARRR